MTSPDIWQTVLLVTIGGLSLYAVIGALLFLFQSHLIYFPRRELVGTPADAGLSYESVRIRTDDHLALDAWFVPAREQHAVLLYFHGNAGNISHRLEALVQFHQLGLSTLIIDYRGYGKSEGKPTESGTYLDARAAWKYLTVDRLIPPDQIVLLGRSLGGAIAARLASEVTPRALVIESTFTSIPDRGAELYPYFPVRLLARFHYDTINMLPRIRCPILIVHSPEDEIVPFNHSQHLFDAAPQPKEFLQIQGGHNDGNLVSADQYEHALIEFITRH
jgi:fermentation-respiration switch protein FrsA (DUF1100 family)